MRNPKSDSHYNNESFKGKTLEEYKSDYPKSLEYYKKQGEDNDEINFIETEIILITESIRLIIENQKSELKEKEEIDFNNLLNEKYSSSYKKIISFLETRKSELLPESSLSESVDLSDTSAVEKIIYLNELGIIDFLRTKSKAGISNSSLASILSGITGIKADTLKPSLNRLSSNDKLDNRHPYYTKKTVIKVRKFLDNLGF
jgi:hypothetical protein